MKWVYYNWAEWWQAVRTAVRSCCSHIWRAAWGLLLFLLIIILGLTSTVAYAYRQVCAFCRREAVASLIVGFVFTLMTFGWLATFIHARSMEVSAQHRADSLSYTLSKFLQAFDSTQTIVVDGDTIQSGRSTGNDN